MLLAEHRLERCLGAADRVIAMVEGRIAFDGAPDRVPGVGGREPRRRWPPRARVCSRASGCRRCPGSRARGRRCVRARLLPEGIEPEPGRAPAPGAARASLRRARLRARLARAAATARRSSGRVSFSSHPGERVALMGRNGAGKSTLLRHAAGLMKPTRGRVEPRAGWLCCSRTRPTTWSTTRWRGGLGRGAAAVGLGGAAGRAPSARSLGRARSSAWRWPSSSASRRADPPAVVLPRRADARHGPRRQGGAGRLLLRSLPVAVVVATHDPEFVAAFAERVVLLADGAPIADGPAAEVLAGGTYFATETARILGRRAARDHARRTASLCSGERRRVA